MWKDFFYFTKTERQGIIVLVVLVIGLYTIPALLQAFSGPEKTDPAEQAKSEKEYNEFISSIKEAKQDKKYPVCRDRYSSPAIRKRNQTGSVRSEYRRLRHFPQSRLASLDGR